MVCPRCGELLIVRTSLTGRVLVVPEHDDLIQPGTVCAIVAVTLGERRVNRHPLH
jgi:hypothetical protein